MPRHLFWENLYGAHKSGKLSMPCWFSSKLSAIQLSISSCIMDPYSPRFDDDDDDVGLFWNILLKVFNNDDMMILASCFTSTFWLIIHVVIYSGCGFHRIKGSTTCSRSICYCRHDPWWVHPEAFFHPFRPIDPQRGLQFTLKREEWEHRFCCQWPKPTMVAAFKNLMIIAENSLGSDHLKGNHSQ